MKRILPISCLSASLLFSPVAVAGEKTADDFVASITISPILLTLPMVELTGEYKLQDKVGVAGILGVGKPSGYSAWELGAQGRYYLLGDFKSGLQLGAEVVYLRLTTEASGISVAGSGLTAGPFVGGKWTADFGLTLDGQVGAQFTAVEASGGGASSSSSGTGVLLNLNIGWSL